MVTERDASEQSPAPAAGAGEALTADRPGACVACGLVWDDVDRLRAALAASREEGARLREQLDTIAVRHRELHALQNETARRATTAEHERDELLEAIGRAVLPDLNVEGRKCYPGVKTAIAEIEKLAAAREDAGQCDALARAVDAYLNGASDVAPQTDADYWRALRSAAERLAIAELARRSAHRTPEGERGGARRAPGAAQGDE